jgi:hypothetical protein
MISLSKQFCQTTESAGSNLLDRCPPFIRDKRNRAVIARNRLFLFSRTDWKFALLSSELMLPGDSL